MADAIYLWTGMCMFMCAQDGDDVVNHNFTQAALQPLVQMLLQQLTKQEEGQEQDDTVWNLYMAAGTCLGLVSQTVQDTIVPLVMPFVQVRASIDVAPGLHVHP